jgi:hypothetical protein
MPVGDLHVRAPSQKALGLDVSFREADTKVIRLEALPGEALAAVVDVTHDCMALHRARFSVAREVYYFARLRLF